MTEAQPHEAQPHEAQPPETPTVGLDPDFIASRVGAASATFDGFIGTGQMSRNARFQLRWDEAADGQPESIVVKIPSGDAGTRAVSFEHWVYGRECSFYTSIAPVVDITVPDCLAVHLDSDDFVIVLEDLAGSEQGDQFREATTAELHLAIEQAAALHAPAWGRTDEPAFDLLRQDFEARAGRAEMLTFFIAAAVDRLGPGLDDGIADLLHRFSDNCVAWSDARAIPTTLVHGDFRADNFMFGVAADAPPIAVVDWQTVTVGLGVTDIAYLISGGLSIERRRAEEGELLDYYRAQLASRGVDYDADQCRREYALTSLHGVAVAVTATTMAEQTERGDALFTQMINRHGRQALDLAALDLI